MLIKLILSDVNHNSNKYWIAKLNDDGSIDVKYGRVGKSEQKVYYPSTRGGKNFLNKKIREKEKKGYKRIETTDQISTQSLNNDSLEKIVKTQIKTSGESILNKLIDYLIAENIHQIVSNTNISYDKQSGVFETPLGVVTKNNINEARILLDNLAPYINGKNFKSKKFNELINEYFMLIPTNFGMKKFNGEIFFKDGKESLNKQLEILDSLEVSYDSIQTNNNISPDTQKAVFDLSLNFASEKEHDRIKQLYEKTKSDQHYTVRNLNVNNVYTLDIPSLKQKFNPDKLNNVWELWHGTKSSGILSILKSGLKITPPSTVRTQGNNFGTGLYFSDRSSKSLQYTTSFWGGGSSKIKMMFLCQVAMGKYFTPKDTTKSPPPNGYNSYFAKANESGNLINNEMIIQKENQHLLTHLVEFT